MIEGARRPAQLGGFFDDLVDVITAPASWAKELAGEIWQHLPSEIRDVAKFVGPTVAGMFLPMWGGVAADAALAILEGDRHSEKARKAIKAAKAEGLFEGDFDPDNRDHLIALAVAAGRIDDPQVIEDLRARLPSNMAKLAEERAAADAKASGLALVVSAGLLAAGAFYPAGWER